MNRILLYLFYLHLPLIKLPTFLGSRKSKRVPEKIFFCFIDYTKAFDCVDHNKLWKILQEMGIPDHLDCLLRNVCAGQEATVRTRHGTMDWFQKRVWQGCTLSPGLFNLCRVYHVKCQAGGRTSFSETRLLRKYQLPQICRWHHPYGRKWRITKDPLGESEIGEWKIWLKTQHAEN